MVKAEIAAQPKPESWREIAREAATTIANLSAIDFSCFADYHAKRGKLVNEMLLPIILAAIERSHAAQPRICDQCSRKLEDGALYEDHAARPQPSKASQWCSCNDPEYQHRTHEHDQPPAKATDDKPKEWTHVSVAKLISDHGFNGVVNAHNAELTAERRRREQAERESVTVAENARQVHIQLLSALAAIEKHNKHAQWPNCYKIKVELSALREHDARLRAQWEKEHEQSK
jgi:hypothetical protein